MTKYLVEEQTLTDIADAIREQTGDENPIMLSNFASEIGNIQGGGSHVELTQAEYDALTDEEKNNGSVYFITDTNGTGEAFQPVIYSTEEREIGVWTDGKPLYEKVVELGALPDNNTKNVPHGIVNLGLVVTASVLANDPNEATISIPYTVVDGSYLRFQTGFSIDGTNISITCGSNRTGYTGIAILRYTKNTDAAGSGTWTPQGVPAVHYSTDEHVIGTWIDGSTLYEKTFYSALPSSGGTQNVNIAHGISNLNIVVDRSISNFIRTGESVGTDGTSQYYTSIQSIDSTNITYKTTVDGAGRYVIITIRYTKSA